MKRKSILFVLLVNILFPAVTNQIFSQNQTDSDFSKNLLEKVVIDKNCPGIGSFIVDPSQAQKMIADFKKIYCLKDPAAPVYALDHPGWVDLNVIEAMAKLLSTAEKIDGFRIYFSADLKKDPTGFPRQEYQNKVSLIIVPTIPANENKHQDVWNIKVPIIAPSQLLDVYINMDEKDATPQTREFFSRYRQETNPDDYNTALAGNLSRSVWFGRCLIDYVKLYMEAYKSDGLRVYSGAYSSISATHPGQIYANQSTFLLVPTKFIYVGREDDWDVSKNLKVGKDKLSAFNHGELCPIKCPN